MATSKVKRGEILDYEETDDDGNVTDTFPMLVVGVNDQKDGDGAVIGTVFKADGTTYTVTLAKDEVGAEPSGD